MLIENPDSFKAWLTSVLEPICNADPEALAKYVYALVKKDKSIDALREGMVEQLDIFLEKETRPFVELLFKTLEKQDYLQPATPIIPNANPPNPNITSVAKTEPAELNVTKEVKPIIPVSSLPDLNLDVVNGVKKDREALETVPVTHKKELTRDRELKKSDSEKEDKAAVTTGGRSARLRHRSTSRNRSRSRSWDRCRRSRSRDRSRERGERERRDRSRPWRNKSPPRRYERRRSRSNSPTIPRNRSPRHSHRGRYRNRSPPRSHSRSRSRSLDKHNSDKDKSKDLKDNKEPLSGAGTPTQDSNHGDTDMRLTSSTQSIQSVVAANPDNASQPASGSASNFQSKRRCRDFDEKGYCMRGELCPYDHGVDPVVLEDTALSSVLTFGPNGQPPHDAPGLLPPPMIRPMHPHHMPPRLMHPGMPPEYNPSAPSMWNPRNNFRGGPMNAPPPGGMFHSGPGGPGIPGGSVQPGLSGPPGTHNHVQRELINVPVMDNSARFEESGIYPRTTDFMPIQDSINIKKKPTFDYGRLGPRVKNPINCSLELKKVPRGLNNITHLNNHFSKFGKIINIQVSFEGDPEAALITFSSHAEANAAYRSTEAVLNNRFIKVFWHNSGDNKQENVPPPVNVSQRSVKERLGTVGNSNVSINNNKVLNLVQPKASAGNASSNNVTGTVEEDGAPDKPINNFSKTTFISNASKKDALSVQESKAQANAAIKKRQEILAAKEQLKKKQEEKRKEAVKISQNLIKRKQELLDKQLKQQKILIGKLEKVKGGQREALKQAIHSLQQSIADIQKNLTDTVKQLAASTTANSVVHAAKIKTVRKSKDEAQKELLDAELDLITKQQEGADTSDLQKRVLELKRYAQTLGIPPSRRGHVSLRVPRGNKFARLTSRRSFANASVDHRPTKVLVSGYELDEKMLVLAHFAQFGAITDYVTDDSTPSVVFNFKTRKEAEIAILKGKQFQDRTLSVTWCTNVQLSNQLSTSRRSGESRTMLLNESDDDHLLDLAPEDELSTELVDLSEETLLQDDEEEEEENEEDRSWRR